jgi:peptidoglycan/LPS O-acetylase OafA/YrhL
MQISTTVRLKEIDFLRGIAVLLVICRHFDWIKPLQEMGWIGVDLFFVLSGFLVSGLLFKEYQQTGKINALRFLVRRGFKIYPVFYSFILFTVCYKYFLEKPIDSISLLGELVFLQNYIGSLWNHTWSLAVEEHFYLLLTAILYVTSKTRMTDNKKLFAGLIAITAATSLALRITLNSIELKPEYLYYSHLRFDSLFWGVFLSHQYHFNLNSLQSFVAKNKLKLQLFFLLSISFTLFTGLDSSFFVRTFGFSVLYLGFGSLLLQFIFLRYDSLIKKSIAGQIIYSAVSSIGFYSYSIYIVHIMMALIAEQLQARFHLNATAAFSIYLISSISAGIMISKLIEIPFLNLRDKYFPK